MGIVRLYHTQVQGLTEKMGRLESPNKRLKTYTGTDAKPSAIPHTDSVIYRGFPHRFLPMYLPCNQSQIQPPCSPRASWAHATTHMTYRHLVWPQPYEKQADRTSRKPRAQQISILVSIFEDAECCAVSRFHGANQYTRGACPLHGGGTGTRLFGRPCPGHAPG